MDLTKAITSRDLAAVESALANGADIKAKDAYGRTALHVAAKDSTAEIVALLIAKGADVNAQDAKGHAPLHLANSETAKPLVANRANVIALDHDGTSPLHTAAEEGNVALMQLLFDAGMKVTDARNNAGLTPLHFAALQGKIESAKFLLDHGADVNAKTLADYTYLWIYVDPSVLGMEQKVPLASTPLSIACREHARNKWTTQRYNDLAAFLVSKGAIEPPSARRALVLLPFAVVTFIALMALFLHLDARMRGWTPLAEKFSATTTPSSTTRQDVFVGTWGLAKAKNLAHTAATDQGLYLAMPTLLRPGHPPLLIPWAELHLDSAKPGIVTDKVVTLHVGKPSITTITLRGDIANEVEKRLKPHP